MFEKRTLPNGIRIVYEYIPYVRSVSFGIWVKNGSRSEKSEENGASHFIEHMVFKGTNTRTAADIAAQSDRLGGQINAYTTKECTCFYGRVLDTHLGHLADILHDMLKNSNFDDKDVLNERGVIFDEIDMYEDTPEDLVIEQLLTGIYKGSSLSRPILGKKSTLKKMSGQFLKDFMVSHYGGENIVIAISGSFKTSDIDNIASLFSDFGSGSVEYRKASFHRTFDVKHKDIEQNHICIGYPGFSIYDDDRYSLSLLSNILGGGMSSRLFQKVRERKGLCYSVYSFLSSYIDGGIFGIYTAAGNSNYLEAVRLILEEVEKIRQDGVTATELALTKEQAKVNVLMSLESTGVRMNRLGRNELFLGRIPSTEELIEKYEAVTTDDILSLAQKVFDPELVSFSFVGSGEQGDKFKEMILS